MSKALIEKLGTWQKVCEHYADLLDNDYNINRQDFIDWMMMQENYSESGYKKGLLGDKNLYYHCYKIYQKIHSDENQHHMVLVSGKIGKGKSLLGAQIAALCDPTFDMSRICYVPPHLFRRLSKCGFGEGNLIDEGGNFFKGRNAMSSIGKDISQAFQLVRDLKQLLIVCYDEPEKIDKDILDKFDSIFIKLYNPNEVGGRKYRSYVGFSVRSATNVKLLLKKKVPITHKSILANATWQGHNSSEFPIINDVTDKNYRTEKRKYLHKHMEVLADKYEQEYAPVDTSKVQDSEPLRPAINVDEYAKWNSMSYWTALEHAKKGIGDGEWKKIGKKYKFFPANPKKSQ